MKNHKTSMIFLISAFLLLAACGGGGDSTPEADPLVELTWKSGTPYTDGVTLYGTKGVPDSTNMPGGRTGVKGFPGSNGDLWFFGGYGFAAAGGEGRLSDMWRYIPSTGQWVWISGPDEINLPGNYGPLGEPGTGNTPGGRGNVNGWTDADGNFWIFGGYGYATSSTEGCLNDMWQFNPADSTWTWINGSDSIDQSGAYGDQGTPSLDNIPGARYSSATWTDSEGNFWLYGGYGYADTSDTDKGYLDDLWKYDLDDNTWTWIGGSSTHNADASYEEDSAYPGARAYSAIWTDSAGNFWMFGGSRPGIGGALSRG